MAEKHHLKLLFDATRLLSRAHFSTPTGIDRVDLAYAEALRTTPGIDTQLIAFGSLGPYRLGDAATRRLLTHTGQRWQAATPLRSVAFSAIADWLNAPYGAAAPSPKKNVSPLLQKLGAIRRRPYLTESFQRVPVSDALYINTSHGRLFRPNVARWLEQRHSGGVFFVHDLIPIEHPEFNRSFEAERHRSRLRLIARHARLVIVNSRATREALIRWWQDEERRQPKIEVIPLGVSGAFCRGGTSEAAMPTVPYFVVLGTIEPRKNHALLLHLWRQLAQGNPSCLPRLLVIGRRGWENETVFNLLDRTPALRSSVAEVSGLSDGEIAQLLKGARALLAPSFAEGYGLPVAEALAVGTPVIASNLSAHREIGDPWIEALDPLDGAAWMNAIMEYAKWDSTRRQQRMTLLATYRPLSWQDHSRAAIAAISAVQGTPDSNQIT